MNKNLNAHFKDKISILQHLNDVRLSNIDASLHEDKEIILPLMKSRPQEYRHLPSCMKNDFDIALAAMDYPYNLKECSEEFKNNFEIVKKSISKEGLCFEYAGSQMKAHKEIALIALEHNAHAYRFIDSSLKDDHDVLVKTLSRSGRLIEFSPSHIQNNDVYFSIALNNDIYAFRYGSKDLQSRDEFIELGKKQLFNLPFLPNSFKDSKEFFLSFFKTSPQNNHESWNNILNSAYFESLSPRLKDDEDIVEVMIDIKTLTIEHASERIRSSPKYFFKICSDKHVLPFMHESILNNFNLFVEALKYKINPESIKQYHKEKLENPTTLLYVLKEMQLNNYDISAMNILVPDPIKKLIQEADPVAYLQSKLLSEHLNEELNPKTAHAKIKV